ncbi:MAG: hypothetical protein AAGF11_46315 [Myxococcota bacterium]
MTEKALIGTDFEEEVCPLQLQAVDDQIRFVEDMLGAPSDEKIRIYAYGEGPPDCDGLGCYTFDDSGIIKTHWSAIDHEVVHAVEDRFVDRPRTFWSEGTAVALEEKGTLVGSSSVLDNIHIGDYHDLDYLTSGHFVRWLLENEDPTLVRRMLKGESINTVYGRSIEQLAAAYEAERPYAYPPWFPCDHPPLPSPEPERWVETIDISCEHPEGTSGENYRRSVVRSVELEAGRYALETIGGSGTRIVGCQMDVWDERPPPMANGDVPNHVENSQTAVGVLFESGEVHEVTLTEGTYKVVVATLELREEVTVDLRRLDTERFDEDGG